MSGQTFILGAGITGLTVAAASGLPVFEAKDAPGGICASYYIRPHSTERLLRAPTDQEAYRFEIGGGHWIFGEDPFALEFIKARVGLKSYRRAAVVYFRKNNLYVPYPLQNNLRFLPKQIVQRVLDEIVEHPKQSFSTMKDWLEYNFGPTLCELFFAPFHQMYTARLFEKIAPQDDFKSPVDNQRIIQGAAKDVPGVGYNTEFVYPTEGLDSLIHSLAGASSIQYNKKAVKIDTEKKEVYFSDASSLRYEKLISTLPLNRMVDLTGSILDEEMPPYTSVLVVNLGALKGGNCPKEHWLYLTESKAGFHRVGFYSNVDFGFLPLSMRKNAEGVSIYVEKSFSSGDKPSESQIKAYADKVIEELKEWGFIKEAQVVDANWIEVAYTWRWPGSHWRENALKKLEERGIYQAGRFGRWKFQGILDSVKDGLNAAAKFKKE